MSLPRFASACLALTLAFGASAPVQAQEPDEPVAEEAQEGAETATPEDPPKAVTDGATETETVEEGPAPVLRDDPKIIVLGAFYVESPTGHRHHEAIVDAVRAFDDEHTTKTESGVESSDEWKGRFVVHPIPYVNEKRGIEILLEILELGYYTDGDGARHAVDIVLGPTDSGVYVEGHAGAAALPSPIKTPVISSLVTAAIPITGDDWFFRTNISVEKRAQAIYDYLNKFWIRRVTVIYADTQFGRQAEASFKRALTVEQQELYTALPFDLARNARSEISDVLKTRPEALGILGEREDIEIIYESLGKQNADGIPYEPFLFTILDARSTEEHVDDLYFVSVIDPDKSGSLKTSSDDEGDWYEPAFGVNTLGKEVWDDVAALSYDTTTIVLGLLKEVSPQDKESVNIDKVIRTFRARFSSALSSNSQPVSLRAKSKSKMSFSNFANRSTAHILHMKDGRVAEMDPKAVVDWDEKARFKLRLIAARYGRMPLLNVLVILVVVVLVSVSDLHRWNVGRLSDLFGAGLSSLNYLWFILLNFVAAVLAFVWMAETAVVQYDNVSMAVAIGMAPATFAKANFFEVWGKKIGMAKLYDRLVVFFTERVRLGMNEAISKKAEVLAFYNSYNGLEAAWKSLLRQRCTVAKRTSFQAALEEELDTIDANYEKRKCYGRWLLRVADWEKLKTEGCIPEHIQEDDEIENPIQTIRAAVRYCMNSADRQEIARRTLQVHLDEADPETRVHFKNKIKGREPGRDQLTARLQLLHLRFNYDSEMLRMCGLLPPRSGGVRTKPLGVDADVKVRVSFYDRAPHLYIGDRYIPIEYDARLETYGTHHLPYTRYKDLSALARDFIDFHPVAAQPAETNGESK
jgi:ABC-type branched-subunit amino acid transport system substrate-binding protein